MTRPDEQGLAAPLVVGLAAVLTFVTLGGALLGRIAVDERRAAAAADLAALTGATELQYGRAGCPAARRTAAENDAILTGCVEREDQITVDVVVPAELLGWDVELRGRAKAGPVDG